MAFVPQRLGGGLQQKSISMAPRSVLTAQRSVLTACCRWWWWWWKDLVYKRRLSKMVVNLRAYSIID
jgi:hypothetical protein